MTKPYNGAGLAARLRQLGCVALLAGAATAAQAQTLPYTVANTSVRTGTYTDLGTTGTAIATANNDDANSTAQNIGFTFRFNGTNYTQFILNTNGVIKLGTVAPAAADGITYSEENVGGPLNTAAETDVIMPFNIDLEAGTGTPEYRVAVTGTTPNQVCTIQWKNVRDKSTVAGSTIAANVDAQFANFSFQAKLYEGSNNIEFVYGPSTATTSSEFFKFSNVGLKGSGTAANQVLLAEKLSSEPWASCRFQSTLYQSIGSATSTQGFNIKRSVRPTAGLTYSFTLPVATDVAAALVYTNDQLGAPWQSPTVIRALVRNAGTAAVTNVSVGLAVTGANTATAASQTVASIAVGASAVVTFPAVAMPNLGNNTVTVTTTLAGDGNATNNSVSTTVVTNATTSSYRTPNANSANVVFAGGEDIYFAAKFTLTAPRDITTVTALISSAGASATSKSSVGETVYAVVANATTGAVLARSANYVITNADIDAYHTFTLSAPVSVPTGDVLAGMARAASTSATLEFYPYGVQDENTTRPNTFYIGDATAPATPSPLFNTAPNNAYKLPYSIGTTAPATCPTPSGITVGTATAAGSVTVSFTGPANGTSYQVVYVPTGTTPTASSPFATGTASPITVTGLTAGTGYDIYVRTVCSATDQSFLAGPTFVSTPCAPPIITAFPYNQNFDVIARGQDLPCGITVTDDNADNFTWEPTNTILQGTTPVVVTRNASAFAMLYQTNPDGITAADDWFYLPAMRFVLGTRYRVSFYYRNNSTNAVLNEALEVKYGIGQTPAGQTNPLYLNNNILTRTYAQATNTSTPAVADITPAATGLNYIGFHCISPADRQFLAIDDVTVIAVLGTSEALTRAVNVYPNPSNTGRFTLDVNGANAKGAMQVEVTNMLGQRVYTSTAKDNFSNDLNLSGLAAGIYSLKVRNGADYTQQQISIVK